MATERGQHTLSQSKLIDFSEFPIRLNGLKTMKLDPFRAKFTLLLGCQISVYDVPKREKYTKLP
jgi:hypothetical protein